VNLEQVVREEGSGPRSAAAVDGRSVRLIRLGLALLLALVCGGAYALSPGLRAEIERAVGILLTGDVAAVKGYILSYGVWAPVISSALMLLQAVVSPLPAFLLTFANGLAFGAFWGGMLSLVSTTAAAGACFLLARVVGRTPVEALVGADHLRRADRWFERWGTHAVLAARLFPFMSVDLISYAAGLTSMRLRPFLGATFLGIIPSTFLYSYLGERATRYVLVLVAVNVAVIASAAVLAVVRRVRRKR
jgi:uncharacterized membrane protein YdjX (TVP38/TMEM64 family)